MKWQPIETAPKDGRLVFLYEKLPGYKPEQCIVISSWDGYYWENEYKNAKYCTYFIDGKMIRRMINPSMWHPYPEPPKD